MPIDLTRLRPTHPDRVHTTSLPILGELHQLYAATDEGAVTTLLAKLAVEKSQTAKLEETRQVHSWA